jgi:hypothetical protein
VERGSTEGASELVDFTKPDHRVLNAFVALPLFTTLTQAQPTPCSNCKGAPGPIAEAGLPILAVGYGVYWMVKRGRQAD